MSIESGYMTQAPEEKGPERTSDEAHERDGEGISALLEDVRQLADDARTFAEAELAYQGSRARVLGGAARSIATYGLIAFLFAFFALGALTVGALIALTPLVTAWGATAIVAGTLLMAALICLLAARGRWRRASALLSGKKAQ